MVCSGPRQITRTGTAAMVARSAHTCHSKLVMSGEDESSTDSCRGVPGRRAGELGVEKEAERNIGPMITLEN